MSRIEWTEKTWNPVVGCTKVSEGCRNCYAIYDARRLAGHPNPKVHKVYKGLTKIDRQGTPQWAGKARVIPERLGAPIRWRKPRRIFVNSMSDLFHPDVRHAEISAIFHVMACAPQHIFQVLTKRPERMLEWWRTESEHAGRQWARGPHSWEWNMERQLRQHAGKTADFYGLEDHHNAFWKITHTSLWPLPHVWLGVSVESQDQVHRIDTLRHVPAGVRWISAEPLLGPLSLNLDGIDWVVVGGESKKGARPVDVEWILDIIAQCRAQGVAVFVKQLSQANYPQTYKDPSAWPEALRIREYPTHTTEVTA